MRRAVANLTHKFISTVLFGIHSKQFIGRKWNLNKNVVLAIIFFSTVTESKRNICKCHTKFFWKWFAYFPPIHTNSHMDSRVQFFMKCMIVKLFHCASYKYFKCLFPFLLPNMIEKILFLCQTLESYVLSSWFLCVFVGTITKKQISE